jgi:HK97 family phage major capsid protein
MSKEVLDALAERDAAITGKLDEINASQKSLDQRLGYLEQRGSGIDLEGAPPRPSLGKIISHLANPRDHKLDGKEAEWHEELSQKMASPLADSVWVPLQTKAGVEFNTASPTSGASNLVPTDTLDLIDVLRQQSLVMQQGVTMIPAEGQISIPRKSADCSGYWFSGDGGDSITESNPTFEAITLSPKFVGGLVTVSYRMMVQTGNAIDGIIERDLMGMIAEEIDQKALQGTGSSNQPTGLLNVSGLTDAGWGRGTSPLSEPDDFNIRDAVYLEKLLIDAKALRGNLSFLFDPASYQSIQSRTDSNNQTIFDLDNGRRSLLGYSVAATSHMPSNTVVFGNWSEFIMANYGGVALAIDDGGTNFAKGTRAIRAIMPIDFNVRHVASFVKAAKA